MNGRNKASGKAQRRETLLLILLPCLSLLLAAMILLPQLRVFYDSYRAARQREELALEPNAESETGTGEAYSAAGVIVISEEPSGHWRQTNDGTVYLHEDGRLAVGLCRIDGKLCFFKPNGVKASSLGVDVSFYNEHVDWKTVREEGIDFAIIRAGARGWSKGSLYGDIRAREYLRGAREAGLKTGVYYYSTAINTAEAVEEAEYVLRTLNGIPLDMPIYIDMEYSGEYPRGRADLLSREERVEIASAFCSTVASKGYAAGVYAGENYLKYETTYDEISRYSIWLASYTREYRLPDFDRDYDLWQFTDRGLVKGMPGPIDLNVIF